MKKYIKINRRDTVGIALEALAKSEKVKLDGVEVILLEDIPKGHKFALLDMSAGTDIFKCEMAMGHATQDIKKANGCILTTLRQIYATY